MSGSLLAKIGYCSARSAFQELRSKLDPRGVNGGVFLGLEGVVIKSHGGTDALGFARAVEIGYEMAQNGLLSKDSRHELWPTNMTSTDSGRSNATTPAGSRAVTTQDRHVRSVVAGVGSYLPSRVLTNAELAVMVDTNDDWIVQRTGIRERHIAADGETTSMLGEKAARAALANAGLTADDIDLVIVGTSTPDFTFPSTATQIQAAWRHRGGRLRPSGGLFRIRFRVGDGR